MPLADLADALDALLRDALAALVAAAGVLPGGGPATARDKVVALLRRDGCRGGRSDPEGCPIASWLRRHLAGLGLAPPAARLLVTPARAVLSGAWDAAAGGVARAVLELPPSVRAAIEFLRNYGSPDLLTEAA